MFFQGNLFTNLEPLATLDYFASTSLLLKSQAWVTTLS